jgi:DUF4097 and DUF4098 domain-containing protein YvlB
MRVRNLVSVIALSLAVLAGPVMAQDSIDKVMGGITPEAGKEYGSLESVNGGITLREGASARSVQTVNGGINVHSRARVGKAETVNGGIDLDADASADSLEAVNGGISLGERVRVADGVESVNGGIRLATGAKVGGDVENVNGAITLMAAEVGGDITTTHGDITLAKGSVVQGGILVEAARSSWWSDGNDRKPRIVIGAGCSVRGTLVFEREVELFVHPTAKVGTVTGATAQPFTDTLPPRD